MENPEEEKKTALKHTSIILVGHCNEDPRLQCLIGTLVFRTGADGRFEPQLINPSARGMEDGSAMNSYKPRFNWYKQGEYGLCFPTIAGGDGVILNLSSKKAKYSFITGINRGDCGSTGLLSNGGPELTDALDELFGFT